MEVQEISRILVTLKKKLIRHGGIYNCTAVDVGIMIDQVRDALELRRRSRDGIKGVNIAKRNAVLDKVFR